MKLARRQMLALILLGALALGGCPAGLAGKGGQAVEASYPRPYPEVYGAALAALGDVGVTIHEETELSHGSRVVGTAADGTPVTLEVTSLGVRQTRLCVQAGRPGGEGTAQAVVDRVAARLHLAASPAQGQPPRQ